MRDKSALVIKNFNRKLRTFKRTDIDYNSGSGVFGTVKMGRLISIQQVVAVKSFNKNASNAANLAKTLISDEMSRNPFFLALLIQINCCWNVFLEKP